MLSLLPILKSVLSNKITLYIGGGLLIYLLWMNNLKLRESVGRLENNQIALTEQYSRQLDLNRQDFQRIYHKEDSIAKVIGIKPKQLEQVIVNNYHYKDSISTTINIPYKRDSLSKDTIKFIEPLGCMNISGYIYNNSIKFTGEEFSDILHTFLYKRYDHKFLFFKWGKYIDAKTYSECKNDTISVEKNIKIINN